MVQSSMEEQNEPPPASSLPGWQTAASILLLLHLFCLAIGLMTNLRPPSAIRKALGNVPLVADYLRFIHFDQAYDYPLTQGRPADGSHRLQLVLAGSSDGAQIILPDEGMWPAIRRQRYENLAFQIADLAVMFENDPHLQTLLVTGIAKWLLIQEDASSGMHTLRCMQRIPQTLEDASTTYFSGQSNPVETYETIVETRLLWDGQSELLVSLTEKENLTASVIAPVNTPHQPTGQRRTEQSGDPE